MKLSKVFLALDSEDQADILVGLGASSRTKNALLRGGLARLAVEGRKIRQVTGDFALTSLLNLGGLYADQLGLRRK